MRATIVVPCYNEEARLSFGAFTRFLAGSDDVHFLFVDDGSVDDTGNLLAAFERSWPSKVTLLRMPQNSGKAEAVRTGMLFALERHEPAYVGFWDADLATPLQAIVPFILLLDQGNFDIVFGSRVKLCGRHIERQPVRHYLGRVFATAVSIVLDLPIYDTQCGAKLFRNTAELREILMSQFYSRWVFDVEMLARLLQLNTRKQLEAKLYEYPLESWRDVKGSKVKLSDFFRAILEVAAIWHRYIPTARKA